MPNPIQSRILSEANDPLVARLWRALAGLRSVVGFRGYAQRDPLNEYKTESFQLFEGMLDGLRVDVTEKLSKVRPLNDEEQKQLLQQFMEQQNAGKPVAEMEAEHESVAAPGFDENDQATWGNPGRNAPCPCGSGKKFKHCHGELG